nr:EOG090X0NBY [Triops cancriformis]
MLPCFCSPNYPLSLDGVLEKQKLLPLWQCMRSASSGSLQVHQQPEDQVTHTGQQWEASDRRMARFGERPKQVNPMRAIDLIAKVPPKVVKERIVACDGGGGALGHPKVYINLDKPGNHDCGYCGLRFRKEDGHGHH